MKIFVYYSHVRTTPVYDHIIEQHLRALLPLVKIEEAHVRLEHRLEASPGFFGSVHLIVPGPDLRAEANDHTAATTLSKLLAEIRTRAQQRAARRERTGHESRRLPAYSGRH